jgi:hypothetical protein
MKNLLHKSIIILVGISIITGFQASFAADFQNEIIESEIADGSNAPEKNCECEDLEFSNYHHDIFSLLAYQVKINRDCHDNLGTKFSSTVPTSPPNFLS